MASEIRVIKGKVQITGDLTPEIVRTITTRHRTRTDVEVWRAKLDDLDAFVGLEAVERLAFVNCRIADPAPLARVASLRILHLNQVTPTGGWGFLAAMTQLEQLELLNIRDPFDPPSLAELRKLRRVMLWGCRGLSDASPLESAPALEELECVDTGLELRGTPLAGLLAP